MDASTLRNYIVGKINRGDTVLIEYESTYPIDEFSWGLLIPFLVGRDGVVVADFYGIGNLLFRNYVRKISGREYSELIGLMKRIKVVRIGPGSADYGEVVEEIAPSYEPHTFLKNYHTIISRMSRLPSKPEYFVTFGLGHYIHFGGDEAIKSLITAVSTIPMEDWVGVHFINENVMRKERLAMLEEVSSMIFHISREGLRVKKEGESLDRGG
jgi:hypothetical protein